MSAVTEFLFPAPERHSSVRKTVLWWERRRPHFNLLVGAAGTLSLGVVLVQAALPPHGSFIGLPPWEPIALFGVMANICYLMGPAVELLAKRIWGPRLLPIGPALFRMGLTFSVGLALLPALVSSFAWAFRLFRWIL